MENSERFDQWCILDLSGHQRTAGHVTEATVGGCAFIRIEVPEGEGFRTEYYGNGAIYSMRPVSEEIAREVVRNHAAPPVSQYDVPALLKRIGAGSRQFYPLTIFQTDSIECLDRGYGGGEIAVRIRKDGRMFCAAMHPEQEGDCYINDGLHYHLSVEAKILVTEEHEQHAQRGEWWWRGRQPNDVVIDEFYLREPDFGRATT